MELRLLSVCRLAFLITCCVFITVRRADGTFVPGRCLCPETQDRVRGQLKDITVLHKSASCDKVTLIVTLKSNSERRCLNPEAAVGKQLIRCWNRATKMGRDVKLCLKRRRRGQGRGGPQRPRTRQRSRGLMRRSRVLQ